MDSSMRWDCLLKQVERFVGIVAVLLLISLGLELYARLIQEQASFAGLLLLEFLASWIHVLGVSCLALVPVLLLVRARTSCR
ncbi:hypothetical protein MYX04_08580 [Nitrospiraceae bacterium AH_259_D15_M11_P09]|nr:hypothetical protein [Nitrospiraceae bacterium AH_259_D15_M11_P09]